MQPPLRIHPGIFEPRASQFAAVIDWLKSRGVPEKNIADALGYTAGNVRTIYSRWRKSGRTVYAPASQLVAAFEGETTQEPYIHIPSAELCEELGISSAPDYVTLRPAEERELDALEAEIGAAWVSYARENRFGDGILRMRTYIPRLGYPRSCRRIRILAQLRHYTAWFLVHRGQARSALDQAMRAVALSQKAYSESDQRDDLARVAESALIVSMAHQLRNEPEASWRALNLAHAARNKSGESESPGYFRQRGVVHLLYGHDEEARSQFEEAMLRMRYYGDSSTATVEMTGRRQMNLLGIPDWDKAQEILIESAPVFPEGTLQFTINANWAGATGLATGSHRIGQDAMLLLDLIQHSAKRFGHQATVTYLLASTPRLKLSAELLRPWLLFALYHDAFRDE